MKTIIMTLLLMGAYYPRIMTVTDIETETEMVVCDDEEGNIWAYYGTENIKIGDKMLVIMDNKGTKEIYDDLIVEVYSLPYNE